MSATEEEIFESPAPDPDDEFWLEQGRKMVEESVIAVREAAKALMMGLGLLKGIYLGILGLADFIPKSMHLAQKALFTVPLCLWMIALYTCLQVLMTKELQINLHAPDVIREKSGQTLKEKQRNLQCAFWTLVIGLIVAMALLIFRLKL